MNARLPMIRRLGCSIYQVQYARMTYFTIIANGSDADIAIVDPARKIKVDWHKMVTDADWSPFQGGPLAGFAEKTFSRGRLIVDDYKFVGENGWGRFLSPETPGRL